MKCGCKRNLLGVCSCKRVSRGRGRKTRRALTDEPYERTIKPRYAVPRSRRPELNFPAIDPKRPGQVLRPGVPSVSTGFTAPSPFSRGATSAFEPVLRAASNYINEITRTARLQNQMTMSNMGGGGSAGSGSNIIVNGSVNSRNTASVISVNRASAPVFDNVNYINPQGNYASSLMSGSNQFDQDANLAQENLQRFLPQNQQNQPQSDINYQNQIDEVNDDNSSTQAQTDQQEEITNVLNQNANLNEELNNTMDEAAVVRGNNDRLFENFYNEKPEDKQKILRDFDPKIRKDFISDYMQWLRQNVSTVPIKPPTPPVTPQRNQSSAENVPVSSGFGPFVGINSAGQVFNRTSPSVASSPEVTVTQYIPTPTTPVKNLQNLLNSRFDKPVFTNSNNNNSSSSSSTSTATSVNSPSLPDSLKTPNQNNSRNLMNVFDQIPQPPTPPLSGIGLGFMGSGNSNSSSIGSNSSKLKKFTSPFRFKPTNDPFVTQTQAASNNIPVTQEEVAIQNILPDDDIGDEEVYYDKDGNVLGTDLDKIPKGLDIYDKDGSILFDAEDMESISSDDFTDSLGNLLDKNGNVVQTKAQREGADKKIASQVEKIFSPNTKQNKRAERREEMEASKRLKKNPNQPFPG
jgi:hypothetical protein